MQRTATLLTVLVLAVTGCSAAKLASNEKTASSSASSSAASPTTLQWSRTASTDPTTTTAASSPLEGTWTLRAATDECALDAGSLDGQTLTVSGNQATMTNQSGNFVGPVTTKGTTFHVSADQQLTQQPTDTSSPLPPPHLDLDIVVASDTFSGSDQYSAVSPGGQTGFSCQRTFTGTRAGTTSGGDAADGPDLNTGGAAGSGCTPGDVSTLPDGWWAGTVAHVSGSTIDFDLVCYFTGDAANAAAVEDGKPTPVDDDRYVRNNNPKTFPEQFASGGATATCTDLGAQHFPCTVGDVLDLYTNGIGHEATVVGHQTTAFPYLWVHVSNGRPDSLYMQFTP